MKFRIPKALLLIFFTTLLIHCKKEQAVDEASNNTASSTDQKEDSLSPKEDSIAKSQEIAEKKVKPNVDFSTMIFTKSNKDSLMEVFNTQFSEDERYAILALNRLDSKNKWRADTLVIPAKVDATLMSYSPFPFHLDVLNDVGKFVIFSYPIQAYAVYSNGNLVKWGPTSMGKKAAQTKRGLMFANWKKELSTSTVDSEWKLPYNFNIHNTLGIGWHQYDLPGYPASHSCLRLLMNDAKWLFSYADSWILNKGGATVRANGTPVIVFGDYAWGKKKPWKYLDVNPKGTDYSVEQMNAIIQPQIDKILAEQKKRAEVVLEVQKEKESALTNVSTEGSTNEPGV